MVWRRSRVGGRARRENLIKNRFIEHHFLRKLQRWKKWMDGGEKTYRTHAAKAGEERKEEEREADEELMSTVSSVHLDNGSGMPSAWGKEIRPTALDHYYDIFKCGNGMASLT
jgi:hypothetical protein